MTKTDVTYALDRGVKNPRDGVVSWQLYDWFETLPRAKNEARRINTKGDGYCWRIVRSETVWLKEPE